MAGAGIGSEGSVGLRLGSWGLLCSSWPLQLEGQTIGDARPLVQPWSPAG